MLTAGDKAPDFELTASGGRLVRLGDFRGSFVVLYFYPRDNTAGCTTEALDFTVALPEFKACGAQVLGVSPDTVAKHEGFSRKHGLQVELLADSEHRVIESYGAWQAKTLYGKTSMGVVRSTFLIDPDGLVVKIWPKVKVSGHVADVLADLRSRLA